MNIVHKLLHMMNKITKENGIAFFAQRAIIVPDRKEEQNGFRIVAYHLYNIYQPWLA